MGYLNNIEQLHFVMDTNSALCGRGSKLLCSLYCMHRAWCHIQPL